MTTGRINQVAFTYPMALGHQQAYRSGTHSRRHSQATPYSAYSPIVMSPTAAIQLYFCMLLPQMSLRDIIQCPQGSLSPNQTAERQRLILLVMPTPFSQRVRWFRNHHALIVPWRIYSFMQKFSEVSLKIAVSSA